MPATHPVPASMPAAEARLVREVLAASAVAAASDDLEIALARLRNLRVKYRDRLKRARLDARTGGGAGCALESIDELAEWLAWIERAESHARACRGGACQPPGPADPADTV